MDRPLIHDITDRAIKNVLAGNHHAIALIGPYGAGKGYLAEWLASQMIVEKKPGSIKTVKPEAGSLGIDQIREITSFLRLKTTGNTKVRRVVIVEDAHTMTLEAQNALLKTLEEPPTDTRIILTIIGKKALLPTVYSRIHSVNVQPVTEQMFIKYKGENIDEAETKKAYAISGGLAGLGVALIDDTEHKLKTTIAYAKDLLAKPMFERLLEINNLSKDKEQVDTLLFALKRVLSAGLQNSEGLRLKRLLAALNTVYFAEASLLRNPNLKLTLTNVMLNL